jgi:hypothetical protein
MKMATKNATVVELPDSSNGFRYEVEVEGEQWPWHLSGLGAPKGAAIGDKGILTFVSTSSVGFWSWKKVENDA